MVEKTRASRFICWFVEVCDCVTAGTIVWGKFLRVESRSLCAATSNCELGCTKLGSFAVFVSCASTKRSDCCVQKFSLAGYERMNSLKRVVRGTPAKIFDSWCCARIFRTVLRGKRRVAFAVSSVG